MVYPGSRIKLAFASEVVSKYHNRSYTFQCVLQVAIGALEIVIYQTKVPRAYFLSLRNSSQNAIATQKSNLVYSDFAQIH